MPIKKENERITITITPKQKTILECIMKKNNYKTYSKAFDRIFDEYEVSLYYLQKLIADLNWEELQIK